MAKYIATFADKNDKVCNTYEEALQQKGFREIYIAPDGNKKWRDGHPVDGQLCFVLDWGEPVRAKYTAVGTAGFYVFPGYENTCRSVHKTDGWLPMDWFRYVQPDDEEMRRWQEEDEYGDADDYGDLGPVDCCGNYVL